MENSGVTKNRSLLIAIGVLGLLIGIIVVAVAVSNNDEQGAGNDFCQPFGIGDAEARRLIALEMEVDDTVYSFPNDLECIPAGAFNAFSDAQVTAFAVNPVSIIFILDTDLKAIHQDAFVSKVEVTDVTRFSIRGTLIEEIPDNLFAPFTRLLSLSITDNFVLNSVSDNALGNVTSLRDLRFGETGPGVTNMPLFFGNQIRMLDLNIFRSLIEFVETGLLSGLEFLEDMTVVTTPLFDQGRTQSDLANLLGINERTIGFEDLDFCFEAFIFFPADGLTDNELRKQVSNFMRFDENLQTLFVGGGVECFPNDLFQPLEEADLEAFFPSTPFSLVFQSPLLFIRGDTFSQQELFNSVTSLTFRAPIFSDPLPFPDNLLQHFTSLEEFVISEAGSGAFSVTLDNNFFGSQCSIKRMKFINILGFTSFPPSLAFCEGVEELDFSGSRDFVGDNSEILDSLTSISVIKLTGTAIAEANNAAQIAALFGVSVDVIQV